MLFKPNQEHGTAGGRPIGDLASVVFLKAPLQLVGYAGIEGAIEALLVF